MALELSGARRVVESMLDDVVLVTRDGGGRADDVLDKETGELKPTGAIEIWQGPGAVLRGSQLAWTPPLDGAAAQMPTMTAYQALVPLDAPPLFADDVLTVSGSRRVSGPRDPQLVGRQFRVADSSVGTFAVVRVVRLEVIG